MQITTEAENPKGYFLPRGKTIRGLHKIMADGDHVGWLIFPQGYGEAWRLHALRWFNGKPVVGQEVQALFNASNKAEAIAMLPGRVEGFLAEGKLKRAAVVRAEAEDAAAEDAKSREESRNYAIAFNARRAKSLEILPNLLKRPDLTPEERDAIEFSIKTIEEDTYDLKVAG